jgi:hypothetical protein
VQRMLKQSLYKWLLFGTVCCWFYFH